MEKSALTSISILVQPSMSNTSAPICECEICKRNTAFAFPQQLLEAVRARNVVIFAGAGVSTEDKLVFPYTLYEEIS